MNSRDRRRLMDMLDYAGRASRSLGQQSYDDFLDDEKTRLAVERAVELVGEAASKVDSGLHAEIELPWPAIVTTRHILAHAYDSIDYRIIYDVVKHELPQLIRVLQDVVGDETT